MGGSIHGEEFNTGWHAERAVRRGNGESKESSGGRAQAQGTAAAEGGGESQTSGRQTAPSTVKKQPASKGILAGALPPVRANIQQSRRVVSGEESVEEILGNLDEGVSEPMRLSRA